MLVDQEREVIYRAFRCVFTGLDFDRLNGAIAGYLFGSRTTKLFQIPPSLAVHE